MVDKKVIHLMKIMSEFRMSDDEQKFFEELLQNP